MEKFVAYITEKGLFYAHSGFDYRGKRAPVYDSHYVNGKPPVESEHLQGWYFLEGETSIKSYQQSKAGGYGEARWVLRDVSAYQEGIIPKIINIEDADEIEDDYSYYIGSGSPYYRYRDLYKRERDKLPDVIEDVDFEVDYKGELKYDLVKNDYKDLKITVVDNNKEASSPNKDNTLDIKDVVNFYELEKLLVPDIVLHNRPCYISADATYRIVRNYIKNNIDTKQAKITSDYDFCFAVDKVVSIKPFTSTTEHKKANGRSYARPRFSHRKIDSKRVQVFEMCPSKSYQDYTPIRGFKGKNLEDLVENVRLFLGELIEVINKPSRECENCKGCGVVFDKFNNEEGE